MIQALAQLVTAAVVLLGGPKLIRWLNKREKKAALKERIEAMKKAKPPKG